VNPEDTARGQLLRLRALGAERLAAARRGEWPRLEVLEAQRRETLAGLQPDDLQALATAAPADFAALAQDLSEDDRRVECALRSALAAKGAALSAAQSHRRAERDYLKVSRPTS
jgi:hypothetical protein